MATADTLPASELPADRTPLAKLARRDGAIALAALSLWAAADLWQASSGLALAWWLAVLDGAAVGFGLGLLAHEWGHFAGARWGGGIAPTADYVPLFPIFHFDNERSDPGAFRAMGVAGNAAHWGVALVLALGLPLATPGQQALLSGSFAFALGASLTEVPILRRTFAGASNLESFEGLSGALLRRNRRLGIAAGALLFVLL